MGRRVTKIQLRNIWFQLHKWIGLILAALIIPLCLSGSALVWHDALDRIVEPQRHAVSGNATLPPPAYAAAAAGVLAPGARITQLRLPEAAGDPIVVSASAAGKPGRINVYLDPPTARVLEVSGSRSGPLMVLHMLHGSLMIAGGTGRIIVGWLGVAMLVSSISGLWLWWPISGSWSKGLRWRRHRNLDTNLHHLFGFWISLPLFILSLTGAWISFPAFFAPLVGEAPRAPERASPVVPVTSLADALASAHASAPGDVMQIGWPSTARPAWQVTLAAAGTPVEIRVDDATGVATRVKPRPASVARWMRQIHDGSDMGLLWQIVIFLGGLLPAALAVTGIIMWWRARTWRGQAKTRRARAQPAE